MSEFLVRSIAAHWKDTYAPATYYGRVKGLRAFLRHFHALTGYDLRAAAPRTRQPAPRQRIATQDEVDRLLSNSEPWFRLFLLLCSQVALRHSEAARVCEAGFKPEDHTFTVLTKGGKRRTIPTTPEIEHWFQQAPPSDDPLRPYIWRLRGQKRNGEWDCKEDTIWRKWEEVKSRAGVPNDLRLHDLRRTTATALYRETHDLRAVQHFLGHDAMTSTLHYLSPQSPEEMRSLLARLRVPTQVKQ